MFYLIGDKIRNMVSGETYRGCLVPWGAGMISSSPDRRPDMRRRNHKMISYKVVELSLVTDETIEQALNLWTAQGWQFDRLQFVVGEASRRPTMAFALFVREEAGTA